MDEPRVKISSMFGAVISAYAFEIRSNAHYPSPIPVKSLLRQTLYFQQWPKIELCHDKHAKGQRWFPTPHTFMKLRVNTLTIHFPSELFLTDSS
jgi:hypothetical protein